nr:MAG: replication polyprotein [Chemarfal virus 88]
MPLLDKLLSMDWVDDTENLILPPLVPVVPDGAAGVGNTSIEITPASKKRVNPAKGWCFTYNNPNLKFIDILINHYRCLNYVFQLERGTNGTLHIQGVIGFDCKVRPKNVFGNEWDSIHWEVCDNWDASVRYCQKPDSRVRGPWLKGPKVKRFEELKILKIEQLYSWQKRLLEIIEQEPDDRKIYWIWEPVGNSGKTSFCKFLSARYNAMLLTGKANDMKYAIANSPEYPRTVIIDCPRSMMDYISYPAIEEIKNAYFFCGKYESKSIIGNPPHLIVFANIEPDIEKLSLDRWEIIRI